MSSWGMKPYANLAPATQRLRMNVGVRGALAEGGCQQDWTVGWANIELRQNKGKNIMGIVHCVMHEFYV